MKNRGFGQGMYNSFGGKFDHPNETSEECACRELKEETNIRITTKEMKQSKVGIQRYTFDNDPIQMIMHVYHIDLVGNENHEIIGCEEITPEWFDDINEIPLHNMFADDSLWLTTLLSSSIPIHINGSYHFQENCQETNTVLHYFMDVKPTKNDEEQEKTTTTTTTTTNYSLEKRLFHALHQSRVNTPSIKEFQENYAFCNTVRNTLCKRNNKQSKKYSTDLFDVVLDVAGGHGCLGALFLICTSAFKAVVIDPADVGNGSVVRAWGSDFIGNDKQLLYRHECLRRGLPDEIEKALSITTRDRILVVACHACQHLSSEILNISSRYGVHVSVSPCCQKDQSPGGCWKDVSKNLSIPVAKVMDILQCGRMMALGTYDVRLKMIDSKITPQNRIIVCRSLVDG